MANDVFLTELIQFGLEGIDLQHAIDTIPTTKLARMTNVDRSEIGSLRLRPGQTRIAQAPGSAQFLVPSSESPMDPVEFVVREDFKGINLGPHGSFRLDASVARDLYALGCTTVRLFAPPFADVDELQDFADLLNTAGIRVLGVLGPEILPEALPATWSSEEFLQEWIVNARNIVAALGGKVPLWEVWPAPDASSTRLEPETFAHLHIEAYPVLKGASGIQYISGGISPTGHQFSIQYMRQVYESSEMSAFYTVNGYHPWDGIGLQPYPVRFSTPAELVSEVTKFKQLLDQYGDRFLRVWITEFGWNRAGTSAEDQASYLDTAYRLLDVLTDPSFPNDGAFVPTAFWYRYGDDVPTGFWGLRSRDFSSTYPAYLAYFNLGSPEEPLPAIDPPRTSGVSNPAGDVHSIGRIYDPVFDNFRRIFGIGQGLYHGTSGDLTKLPIEFSGYPLQMVEARPPLSNEPWMFVCDSRENVKVRVSDGLMLTVGQDEMGSRCLNQLDTIRQTIIGGFSNPVFTRNAGTGRTPPAPFLVTNPKGAAATLFSTNPPVSPDDPDPGYYNFWGKSISADLSRMSDGTLATDDDLVHLYLYAERPHLIDEVRVYLVLGGFDPRALAGVDITDNHDAYMKAFRPGDFVNFIEGLEAGLAAASTASQNQQSTGGLGDTPDNDRQVSIVLPVALGIVFGPVGFALGMILTVLFFMLGIGLEKETREQTDEKSRAIPAEITHGKAQWTEFGVLGRPLRRGDFLRIGDNPNLSWRDVSGLTVYCKAKSQEDSVDFALSDFYLYGGSGVDNTEPGLPSYDWRTINFDPRTGERSNPSPIQTEGQWLDVARYGVRVTPGEASPRGFPVIQWFYRRGGTLLDNWYFVGKNTTNGGVFVDRVPDAEARTSGTLEIDNDRPVTTVNRAGDTLKDRALPSMWGPVNDMIMGCGDAWSAGQVFWCKPGEPDHWPPQNNVEVCPPSEQLLTGGVYGGEPFVFSREKLYRLYPNLTGETGVVNYLPTRCLKGPLDRWCVAWSNYGIFFITRDGIYRTDGGAAISITDSVIEELFMGRTRHGYKPIDFELGRNYLRLGVYENELWFQYMDVEGNTQVLIYDMIDSFWRVYEFAHQTAMFNAEKNSRLSTMVLGSKGEGNVYQLIGDSDDGTPIVGRIRTGALDQSAPRREKVYGDLSIDFDGEVGTLDVSIFAQNETEVVSSIDVVPTTEKSRHLLDILQSIRKQNISIDLEWSDPAMNIYHAALQYLIDEAVQRIRWESEETDNGVPGQQTPLYAFVSIRSQAEVTFTVTTYRQDGTSVAKSYTIPATGGTKTVQFVPFEATKGVVFRYLFTSSAGFQIYREESQIVTRAWNGQENTVKAFGDALAISPAEIRAVRGVGQEAGE